MHRKIVHHWQNCKYNESFKSNISRFNKTLQNITLCLPENTSLYKITCIFWVVQTANLSTVSESFDSWLLEGASWPPTAYKRPPQTPTPTPPRRFVIGAQLAHLLVCGSKHSTERRHELPSRPPTA